MTDKNRTITGTIIDSQYIIPSISNKLGIDIKEYSDSKILLSDEVGSLPYKIETDNGSLVGFFTLLTNGQQCVLQQVQLRPAFQEFSIEITELLSNFILQNLWQPDYLN